MGRALLSIMILSLGNIALMQSHCKSNGHSALSSSGIEAIKERSAVKNREGLFLVCSVGPNQVNQSVDDGGVEPMLDFYCGIQNAKENRKLTDQEVEGVTLSLIEGKSETPVTLIKVNDAKWNWKITLGVIRALKADDFQATFPRLKAYRST